MSCEETVVCRPLWPFFTDWLTAAVRSPSPGSMAFSRLDFPTPDGPASALIRPHSRSSRAPTPSPVAALVYSTG